MNVSQAWCNDLNQFKSIILFELRSFYNVTWVKCEAFIPIKLSIEARNSRLWFYFLCLYEMVSR